jgi:hypothetical protein
LKIAFEVLESVLEVTNQGCCVAEEGEFEEVFATSSCFYARGFETVNQTAFGEPQSSRTLGIYVRQAKQAPHLA